MNRRNAVASLVAALLAAPVASAEEGEEAVGAPTRPIERRGITASISGGVGELHVLPEDAKEIVSEGSAVSIRLGSRLQKGSLAMAMIDFVNDGTTMHTVFGAALQFHPTRRIYARLGGGMARFRVKEAEEPEFEEPVLMLGATVEEDRWSPGVTAGLGIEWLQLRDLSLNAELTSMASMYPDDDEGDIGAINVSLMLGASWYGL